MRSSETADLFMVLIVYRLKKNGRAAVIVPDGFLFGADNTKIAIKTKLLKDFNLHTIIRLPDSIFAPYTSIATNILFFDNTCAEDAPEGFSTKETVLPFGYARGVQAFLQDQIKEVGALRSYPWMVERP